MPLRMRHLGLDAGLGRGVAGIEAAHEAQLHGHPRLPHGLHHPCRLSQFEGDVFRPVIDAVLSPHDPWLTAGDFRSFLDAQERVAQAYRDEERWTRMSILNTAASGKFSTDRTMRDYNNDIWHLDQVVLDAK